MTMGFRCIYCAIPGIYWVLIKTSYSGPGFEQVLIHKIAEFHNIERSVLINDPINDFIWTGGISHAYMSK